MLLLVWPDGIMLLDCHVKLEARCRVLWETLPQIVIQKTHHEGHVQHKDEPLQSQGGHVSIHLGLGSGRLGPSLKQHIMS